MNIPFKIYVIHNPLTTDSVTWLSYLIRHATDSHWNHIAIEIELHGKPYIIESIAKGVTSTPKEKWLKKSDREVLPLTPKGDLTIDFHELFGYMGTEYGYLDLIQIAKYLAIKKYFDKDYTWDGKSGTRLWKGMICSELAAILIKMPNPHLVFPCDFENNELFTKGEIFKTIKNV